MSSCGSRRSSQRGSDQARSPSSVIEEIPAVAAHGLAVVARIEASLARALAVDLASPPQDPTPHMVASAAVAALYRSALTGDHFEWNAKDPTASVAHFDRALRFIRHGLDGLRHDDDRGPDAR